MPRISFSKESLESKPAAEDGLYEVRLEGFEPKPSKDKNSVNLNPVMKVINHQKENGRRVYDNLNVGAPWIIKAFCHAFGLDLAPDGSGGFTLPGDFNGPENDPSHWSYTGPLTGCVAKVMLKQTEYNGRINSKVDQWLCQTPGCTEKHPTSLAK
jgi:hypothetical protein